jgi:CobQ-like glutamine amidotransferase family enzyme
MLNPKYVDFANHMGFTIAPCNVGKGNEKGRVENGVGYVKKNFLAGLDLPPFSALNPAAKQWLDTVANRHYRKLRLPAVNSKIVQSAGDLHHKIVVLFFRISEKVFDNATSFNPRNDMLNNNPDT